MNTARALAVATLLSLLLPACRAAETAAAAIVDGARPNSDARLVALAAMPTPRAAHSATRLPDGRVLLAGGCSADGCEEGIASDGLLFDPDSLAFMPAGALVQPRVGHRAIALADGSVLLLGGYTADGPTALVERYSPDSGQFTTHGQLREARDGLSATLLEDGTVLVAGGYAAGMRRLSSAERYDPASGRSRQVGAMTTPRMSHTATLLSDGRVLLAGGSRARGDVNASVEVFDPATEAFSVAGELANARHKHAAIAIGGRVLLIGGAAIPEAQGHFRDSEAWSPDGLTTGPAMQSGRYKFLDAVATLTDGSVLVAGGGAHAERLDAAGTSFQPVDGAIGNALAFASATALDDGRVLVAGGYDRDIRVSRKAWLLTSTPGAAAPAPRIAD